MRTDERLLVIDGPQALHRVLERPRAFSALRIPPDSPAADLEGRLNAAYAACGCEMARLSALAGLVLAAGLAVLVWPGEAGWTVWRCAATILAGLAGFGVFGLVGERLALNRARSQLIALVAETGARLDAHLGPMASAAMSAAPPGGPSRDPAAN